MAQALPVLNYSRNSASCPVRGYIPSTMRLNSAIVGIVVEPLRMLWRWFKRRTR